MNMLALEFDSSEGGKKQTLTLHGVGQKSVRVDMWSETPLEDQITMDGALCGVIFYAMRHSTAVYTFHLKFNKSIELLTTIQIVQ